MSTIDVTSSPGAFLAAMGGPVVTAVDPVLVEVADAAGVAAHRALRRRTFVEAQGLFVDDDVDEHDDDPATITLVARRTDDGAVLGGVRVHPAAVGSDAIGWWRGSRLVVDDRLGAPGAGIGARLVRAAVALADQRGALRFDATVQLGRRAWFERLGWVAMGSIDAAGVEHVLMRAPSDRFEGLVTATKTPLGRLLAGFDLGGEGWVGDDGAPVPGTDLIAACDAIVPAMVERDPEWAGWCAVLVNVNDLAAMGAAPIGLLDAVAGADEAHVARVLAGVRAAAAAYGVPVLGGHTQLGVHAALSITALGEVLPARRRRNADLAAPSPPGTGPIPGGGGRVGDDVRLVADLAGRWRPGYTGRQWDSTTSRTPTELRRLVATLRRSPVAAAKDVSMAGLVGTLAMLAEASGTGATVDVAGVPRPDGAGLADWLSCFPGFALLTADRPGAPPLDAAPATVATIGRLDAAPGVRLRWPDGRTTPAVSGAATGLGEA